MRRLRAQSPPVPGRGLEPPRLTAYAPKAYVYTISPSRRHLNFTTKPRTMKLVKLLSACFFAILVIFLTPNAVLADYNSAYSDYQFNYSKYREAHNNYQIAKSAYGTYKTLTARAEAVKQMRLVLQARAKLMDSYYDLLTERVPFANKETFGKIKDSQSEWFAGHQKKIDAAGTLDDLNDASNEFETRYPQMETETKQAVKGILLAKEEPLLTRWDEMSGQISQKIKEINSTGPGTAIGERGIISARNKKELAVTKMEAARNTDARELFSAQQRLTESREYLREATGYLNEVLGEITGQ